MAVDSALLESLDHKCYNHLPTTIEYQALLVLTEMQGIRKVMEHLPQTDPGQDEMEDKIAFNEVMLSCSRSHCYRTLTGMHASLHCHAVLAFASCLHGDLVSHQQLWELAGSRPCTLCRWFSYGP